MAKKVVETPLMKQYNKIKGQHPDAILLFRVGDFYETFSDDAIAASGILGITLTRRANGAAQFIELAGFPHHALDTYLPKLVRAGRRVAICDQLEDPKTTKKIVKRGVTEVVTPGVSIDDNVLNYKENNFLAAVHFEKNRLGIALLDISTGEFMTGEGDIDYGEKLLNNFGPKEILIERKNRSLFESSFGSNCYVSELEDWAFDEASTHERLLKQFQVQSLKGFGVYNLKLSIVAAGAILHYLDITQHKQIGHINALKRIEMDEYVRLDQFTIRNLELLNSMNEGGRSLLNVLDRTISPMGSRTLRRWVVFPLKNIKKIQERQEGVGYFFKKPDVGDLVAEELARVGDLERIISKVAVRRILPREVIQLGIALSAIQPIKEACSDAEASILKKIGEELDPCTQMRERIASEINPDTSSQIGKGHVFAEGVNAELDELRKLAYRGKDYLLEMQQRESEVTGISSLKVGFNNVFGYYFEVRNTHKDKVPEEWIRKQTLVNAERYITQELKEYEEKILGAQEKILQIETELYEHFIDDLSAFIIPIQKNARLLGTLDCLHSFCLVAEERKYICPTIEEESKIEIRDGRHPVIESQMKLGEEYIPNDVLLDHKTRQIMMITGPNMAGKSALLRQTALIVLMAQIGSYVPATSANIGWVDKIFTRVGASDNISVGESTFMVEMNEAANILNNITPRSLVLFDELGRGTSTYDGISIAWAIVEYMHEQTRAQALTLFATHYHELNEMASAFRRIKNYNVSVKEVDNQVIFLRKLVAGGSEHSFGIHVARMAGMPKSIVKRADQILKQLESTNRQDNEISGKPVRNLAKSGEGYQLSFFQLDDPILSQVRDQILDLEIDRLTPLEALNKLSEIKKIITGK